MTFGTNKSNSLNHIKMKDLNTMNTKEFDFIVPVDDLCMAVGLVCTSQKRSLHHYTFGDGRG